METLELKKQTANTDVSKAHFVRLADLINYEGPLLVLYKQKYTSNIYLFRWVDADETYNRWILYQSDIANVLAFINRKISHKFLFEAYSDICYAIDIDTNMNWVNVGEIYKTMLPYDYIPIEDDFFDIEDCPNMERLINCLADIKTLKSATFLKSDIHNILANTYPKIAQKLSAICPASLLNSISNSHTLFSLDEAYSNNGLALNGKHYQNKLTHRQKRENYV